MNFNSSLACLICNIKVSIKHHKHINRCRYSKMNIDFLSKLEQIGFVKSFKVNEITSHKKEIIFEMNTFENDVLMIDIKIISTPGCRRYIGSNEIKNYLKLYDGAILTTNQGILSSEECLKLNIGGEILAVYR